jgi:hypothetical protein
MHTYEPGVISNSVLVEKVALERLEIKMVVINSGSIKKKDFCMFP